MVLLLLSGLAYGSYAVGKYVLSEKLFGASVTPRNGMTVVGKPHVSTMTRKVQTQGQGVQVQVLPAGNDATSASDVPSFSDLQRASKGRVTPRATPNRQRIVRSDAPMPSSTRLNLGDGSGDGTDNSAGNNSGNSSSIGSSDSTQDGSRSSRRRRRRSYSDNSDSSGSDSSGSGSSGSRSSRRRRSRSSRSSRSRRRSESGSGSNFSSDSPRSSGSESRPQRSQETSRSDAGGGGNNSPVPRSASGGDSPIPQPE